MAESLSEGIATGKPAVEAYPGNDKATPEGVALYSYASGLVLAAYFAARQSQTEQAKAKQGDDRRLRNIGLELY